VAMQIEDGKGTGNIAEVRNNKLEVDAISKTIQHDESFENGNAYQVQSIDTGITAKTQTVLHVKNTSSTQHMVITYVRMQAVSTGTVPAVGIYWEVGTGGTVTSGGTATTATNMNGTSGKVAPVTATGIDPTMGGTFTAIDRQYIQSNGQELTYNKEGTIVLGLGNTFEIRLTTTGTGEAKSRISFFMRDI